MDSSTLGNKTYKEYALTVAKELHYRPGIIKAIELSNCELEICRLLTTARKELYEEQVKDNLRREK